MYLKKARVILSLSLSVAALGQMPGFAQGQNAAPGQVQPQFPASAPLLNTSTPAQVNEALNAQNQNRKTAEDLANLSPFEQKISQLLEQGDLAAAQNEISQELKEARKNKTVSTSLLYAGAFGAYSQENWSEAERCLQEISDTDKNLSLTDQGVLNMAMAQCRYQRRQYDEAQKYYKAALLCLGNSADTIRADILEGLVGCYLNTADYAGAEAPAKQLLTIKREENTLASLCPRFWANLYLGQVYAHLNKTEERKACQDRMNNLLRLIMDLRQSYESQYGPLEIRRLREQFLQEYLGEVKPTSYGESLWLTATYKPKSMPVICWRPAAGRPVKAIILTVHGLGLENRAFKYFGEAMTARDYVVYAIDVRGFGAWADAAGGEDINYKKCCGDINAIIDAMKRLEPGLPIFLLGESMGGAIALNAAADLDGKICGVIASVPSAERVGARKLNMTVAMHFLKGPNKSFNLGSQIAAQATAKPELREIWANDLKAKNNFSPKELIQFALFMQRTLGRCKDIKKTPVFMVQGLKDNLVKPQGTFDLFSNVSTDDKTILVIGNEEHLILETDTQSPLVINSLDTWLGRRAKVIQE